MKCMFITYIHFFKQSRILSPHKAKAFYTVKPTRFFRTLSVFERVEWFRCCILYRYFHLSCLIRYGISCLNILCKKNFENSSYNRLNKEKLCKERKGKIVTHQFEPFCKKYPHIKSCGIIVIQKYCPLSYSQNQKQ